MINAAMFGKYIKPMIMASVLASSLVSYPTSSERRLEVRGQILGVEGQGQRNAIVRIARIPKDLFCEDLFVGSEIDLIPRIGVGGPSKVSEVVNVAGDVNGSYRAEVELGPGERLVELIEAPGFAPEIRAVDQAHDLDVVRLSMGNTLRVSILDDRDAFVSDVALEIYPVSVCAPVLDTFRDRLSWHRRIPEAGVSTIENIPSGTYFAAVSMIGYEKRTFGPLIIGPGSTEYKFRVHRGRRLTVTLGGSPADSVGVSQVIAYWSRNGGGHEWEIAESTNRENIIELKSLPENIQEVSVLAVAGSGLASKSVKLGDRVTNERSLESISIALLPKRDWIGHLEPGIHVNTLLVELVPEFEGIRNLEQIEKSTVREDGSFVVHDVPSYCDQLRVSASDYAPQIVRLKENLYPEIEAIHLDKGGSITGKIEGFPSYFGLPTDVNGYVGSNLVCSGIVNGDGEFVCPSSQTDAKSLSLKASYGIYERTLSRSALDERFVISDHDNSGLSFTIRDGRAQPIDDVALTTLPIKDPVASAKELVIYARTTSGTLDLRVPSAASTRFHVSIPGGVSCGPGSNSTDTKRLAPSNTVLAPPMVHLFTGHVFSKLGRSVSGAEIEIRSEAPGGRFSDVGRVVRTGSRGEWTCSKLLVDTYRLSVIADGFLPLAVKRILDKEESSDPVDVYLVEPGVVRGRVTREAGYAGVGVRLLKEEGGNEGTIANLSEAGEFSFNMLDPGRYQLFVESKSAGIIEAVIQSKHIDVSPGETTLVDFNLDHGFKVSGVAYLGKEPAAEASLSFNSTDGDGNLRYSSVKCDADGRYALQLPGPGTYRISLLPRNSRGTCKSVLESEFRKAIFDKKLYFPAGTIDGRIVDGMGKGVPKGEVSLWRKRESKGVAPAGSVLGAERITLTQTENMGDFSFYPVPEGEYHVEIATKAFALKTIDTLAIASNEHVALGDIVLDSGSSLEIVVSGPEGSPLQDAMVAAFADGDLGRAGVPPNGISGNDGRLVLGKLNPGTYSIVGLHPPFAPSIIDRVEVGTPESGPVALRFSRGGSLEIRAIRSDGRPISGARSILVDSAGRDVSRIYENLSLLAQLPVETDATGLLRMSAVLDGQYTVRLAGSPSLRSQSVVIREDAGEPSLVVLVSDEKSTDETN